MIHDTINKLLSPFIKTQPIRLTPKEYIIDQHSLDTSQYYEYFLNFIKYIDQEVEDGFKLISRDDELKEQEGVLIATKEYLNNIREQRERNSNYPFYSSLISVNTLSLIGPTQRLKEVLSDRYEFTKVTNLNYQIYSNSPTFQVSEEVLGDELLINDSLTFVEEVETIVHDKKQFYWEFCKKNRNPLDNQYIYIKANKTYLDLLKSKLPTMLKWDTYINSISKDWPYKSYVFQTSITTWSFYQTVITDNLYHPFLGSLLFTGRVTLQDSPSYEIYEYTDIEGHYGKKNDFYCSSLKPLGLDFPLGLPKVGMLCKEECLEELIGYLPSRGRYPSEVGRFTGYITNNKYSDILTYYIYEREDSSVFLSKEIPSAKAEILYEDLAYKYINSNSKFIYLDSIELLEEIVIEEHVGCGVIFEIEDRTCLDNTNVEYIELNTLISSCAMINDRFGLGLSSFMFNDINMIDDLFKSNNCAFLEENSKCLVGDKVYIGNYYLLQDCNP